MEVEEVGKVKDSVNIPFVLAFRAYDSEERKKVVKKEPNPEFVQQVRFLLAGAVAPPDRSITAAQSHQQVSDVGWQVLHLLSSAHRPSLVTTVTRLGASGQLMALEHASRINN